MIFQQKNFEIKAKARRKKVINVSHKKHAFKISLKIVTWNSENINDIKIMENCRQQSEM